MPDLDQIKQGEQGVRDLAGGSPRAGRAIPPAGPNCRDHVNHAAQLLRARARRRPDRDPTALRRCRCSNG
jgi:hypothetical protein